MNKEGLSIWKKVNLLIITCGITILLVNLIVWKNADDNVRKIDSVYGSNVSLNELQEKLEAVQEYMTVYLDDKTSDSMEAYYSAVEDYEAVIQELEEEATNSQSKLMEKNIRNLSETYLDVANETVEAKRARNVEKYKEDYEEAEELYSYIQTYVYSLNNAQFKNNAKQYHTLLETLHYTEWMNLVIMIGVIVVVLLVISIVVRRMTYLEEVKESMRLENMLLEKEHEMENERKDAQLKYLQAQIHPHFLFNCLNAGAQLSMMENAPRSYEYTQNLAEFFRYNLKKQDEVTLAEELELIDHYIYILNVRFAGEIHYEKNVDESLTDLRMPGMILQPIVENSVNYGIRDIMREKKIEIEVSAMDELVCICVRDNGIGISEEKIKEIMEGKNVKSESSDSNGVGMTNVWNRLKLYYNTDEVMTIQSLGENVGTEVMLYLPYNGGGED
ncbi:MAG: histidine kinase [Roseburia sp.]